MEYSLAKLLAVLLAVTAAAQSCSDTSGSQKFVWDGPSSVDGLLLNTLMCVKDTQIDFNVPQTTNANLPVVSLTGGAITYQNLRLVSSQLTLEQQRTGIPTVS
jgi:hypothetical protein